MSEAGAATAAAPAHPARVFAIPASPWSLAAVTALAFALAGAALLTPNLYNTRFIGDVLYLLNAGYLIHTRYVPHIDYMWGYGGYESALIGAAFRLFGVGIKAIEQAVAMGFVVALLLLLAGTARQARLATFAMLVILLAAVSLTRSPLELGHVDPDAYSFAMFYNRLCWALAIVVYATLLLSREPLREYELFAVSLAGFLVLLTKQSFVLLLLPALAPLLHRNGGTGLLKCLGYALALAAAAWLIFGYGPAAYVNTFTDSLAHTSDYRQNAFAPLRKLAYILLYHGLAIAGAAAVLVYLYRREPSVWSRIKLGTLAALILLSMLVTVTTAVYAAQSATTPMLAFAAIIVADEALREKAEPRRVLAAALAFYALAFSVPHLMHYGRAVYVQATRPTTFGSSTLRGLISAPEPRFAHQEAALDYVEARTRAEGGIGWVRDEEWLHVLGDAATLARTLPDLDKRRVFAFYFSTMPFLLESKPVTSYPLMPSRTSPVVRAITRIPREIDTVLVLPLEDPFGMNQRFARSLAEDFTLRGRSRFWELYVRKPGAPPVALPGNVR